MLSGAQIRAARGLLDWSRDELAQAAGLSSATVKRMEGQEGTISANHQTVTAVVAAIEAAGVTLIADDEQGAGVRFKKVYRGPEGLN